MKLTETDVALFKVLHESAQGRDLLDYLGRLKTVLFEPENLTAENLASKKEAWNLIQGYVIDRINLTEQNERSKETTFE